MRLFFSIVLLVVGWLTMEASNPLKITEISICNTAEVLDPNGNYQDWIELYNPDTAAILLHQLRYADQKGNRMEFRLRNKRVIAGGEYALIWLNKEITDFMGNYPDLDADGGFFAVSDSLGNLLDSISYPRQYSNVSYGRVHEDSLRYGYFVRSTPGTTNTLSLTANQPVATPVFSLPGGYYSQALSVSISCATPGARIFYTVDGSEPELYSIEYTGQPVFINRTMPLKVRAFAGGYLRGQTAVATYLINERKPEGMPVVMLTIDEKYLYDNQLGIYVKGTNGVHHFSNGDTANYNRKWTRPGHFELLDNEKTLQLSQPVGVSVLGTITRKYALKSFDIKASKRFGVPRLDYPFFPLKDGRRYKSIALRNGGNNDFPGFIFRDAFSQSLVQNIDLDYQAYEPCVLYVNGKYWGLLNLREKSTKDYIYSNYNHKPDEIDLVYMSEAMLGTTRKLNPVDSLIMRNPIINDSMYNHLKTLIDIDNYINYLTVENVLINTDWPVNNNRHFTLRGDKDRYRWLLNDMDRSLLFEGHNAIDRIRGEVNINLQHRMIQKLSMAEPFQNHLIDVQSIYSATIFSEPRMLEQLANVVDRYTNEFPYHAARWNPEWESWLDVGYLRTIDRLNIVVDKSYMDLKHNFNLGDTVNLVIRSNVPKVALHFNNHLIPSLPYDGKYFKGRKIKLKAPEYAGGLKFRGWLVTELMRTRLVTSPEMELEMNYLTTVEAVYGKAEQVRRTGLYINEISPANSIFTDEQFRYEDWVEIYNNSDSVLSLEGYYLSNSNDNLTMHRFTTQEKQIAPYGRQLVWCSDATWRGRSHTNFKLQSEGGIVFLSKDTPDGVQLVDSITYPAVDGKRSVGRYPDGEEQVVIFNRPSFKLNNFQSTYNEPVYRQPSELITYVEPQSEELNIRVLKESKIITLLREQRVPAVLDFYDMSGLKIRSENLDEYLESFDMSNFSPGLYLLIYSDANTTTTLKIII